MARIRLRYVSGDVDRHGNPRWYLRRPGQPKVRLRGDPGSEEFMAAYHAAMAGQTVTRSRTKRKPAAQNTIAWLCQEYFTSGSFRNELSAGTQRVRRRLLESVCETAGDVPLSDITPPVIRKGMDRRADRPEAANAFLKAMSALFRFGIDYEHVRTNPTVGIRKLRSRNPDGWHTWTPNEVEQFEAKHPVGTKARLALALLLYTGARRSDVVQLGRQHVRDGWLKFRVYKNHLRAHVEVEIPVLPELQAVIDATAERGDLTFLISDYGRPWSSGDSFGNKFRDWCREAGLPHCSPHGLRKAGASRAAERGATSPQLDAIFGWTDPKMSARYTKKASRRTLAGEGIRHMAPSQTGNETVPLSSPVQDGGTIQAKKGRKTNAL